MLLFAAAPQVCFAGRNRYPNFASCIDRVSRGEIWASKNHSEFLLETLRSTPSCEGIGAGKIDQLSRRELQVAEHAAQGESNKQIADRLGLSEHTVKNYLFHVFEKLGVSNRFELLFLLFKECNGSTADRASAILTTEPGHPIETYLESRRRGLRRGAIRCRTGASRRVLRRKERPFRVLLVAGWRKPALTSSDTEAGRWSSSSAALCKRDEIEDCGTPHFYRGKK